MRKNTTGSGEIEKFMKLYLRKSLGEELNPTNRKALKTAMPSLERALVLLRTEALIRLGDTPDSGEDLTDLHGRQASYNMVLQDLKALTEGF